MQMPHRHGRALPPTWSSRRVVQVAPSSRPSPGPLGVVPGAAQPPPPETTTTTSLWRAMWLAVHAVAAVTRNAFVSSLVAWVSALAFSRGNPFHGRHTSQSHAEFLTATLLWGELFFSFGMLVARSSSLFRLRSVLDPDSRMGAARVLLKVFPKTCVVQLAIAGVIVAIAQLSATVAVSSRHWRALRPELYLSMAVNHPYTTWVDVVARRIYKRETVEGRLAATAKQQQLLQRRLARQGDDRSRHRSSRRASALFSMFQASSMDRSSFAAPPSTRSLAGTEPMAPVPVPLSRWSRMLAASTQNLPPLVCITFPTLYVHAMSRAGVAAMARNHIVLFTAASLAVKVAMQETAKHYILVRKTSRLRAMAVVVVVPTVMVDTQMRLVLLRDQASWGATLSGLLLLALVEIVVRGLKLVVLRVHIAHKETQFLKMLALLRAAHAQRPPHRDDDDDNDEEEERQRQQEMTQREAAARRELDAWRARVQQYHMAEVAADMYAEYLAIGCSYAIVFFFRGHAQFAVAFTDDSQNRDNSLLAASHVVLLATQLGMELVVDWLSCCLEIWRGALDFASLERDRGFYLVFFVTLAVLNIFVSSVLFLRDPV